MILVTGSASSGKSAYAEQLLLNYGEKKRIYVATMIPWDDECRARIEKHRMMRAGKGFETAECFLDLETLEIPEGSAVLLECVSNLAANEMYRPADNEMKKIGKPVGNAADRIMNGVFKILSRTRDFVIVTNEVFSDGITYSAETGRYLKMMGELNRRLADAADQVYEVACGIPAVLKSR